jgi:hypothetical protein
MQNPSVGIVENKKTRIDQHEYHPLRVTTAVQGDGLKQTGRVAQPHKGW